MLKFLRRIRTRHYVILALMLTIFCCTEMCVSPHGGSEGPLIMDSYGRAFAGSASCMPCHGDMYRSHLQTAHYHDSRPAAAASIKGSFDSGRNHFRYNDTTEVVMVRKDDRFYQTIYTHGKEIDSKTFDIVIGSGKKGQTYLTYATDGKLYQLPVSYSTLIQDWCISPGYSPLSIRLDRKVNAYCLECHSTYAGSGQGVRNDGDLIDKNQIIYGIDCERCHGPALEHVEYQTAHPQDRKAKYIINPAALSRQQRLDACALCHSGARTPFKPAFTFRVGDTLSKFSGPGLAPGDASTLDVHGNQYELLSSSKCFIQSRMDCSTCHDVHGNERGQLKLFSQRCMTCHTEAAHNTCTVKPEPGLVLGDNCIDCHMPARPSQRIVLLPSGGYSRDRTIPTYVRTHRITIYPDNTKEYLQKLKAVKTTGLKESGKVPALKG